MLGRCSAIPAPDTEPGGINVSISSASATRTLDWARLGAAATEQGLALVLVSRFAPLEAAHNAPHDSRHSFVTRCH